MGETWHDFGSGSNNTVLRKNEISKQTEQRCHNSMISGLKVMAWVQTVAPALGVIATGTATLKQGEQFYLTTHEPIHYFHPSCRHKLQTESRRTDALIAVIRRIICRVQRLHAHRQTWIFTSLYTASYLFFFAGGCDVYFVFKVKNGSNF